MNKYDVVSLEELLKELDKYKFKQFHLHHTWKPVKKQFNGKNGVQLCKNMENFHVNSLKWKEIGQHTTLLPDGKFVICRYPFSKTPSSIAGWNTGAFCCEMIGNFDIKGTSTVNDLGYDKLEGEQRKSALGLTKYFIDRFGENSVKFHNEKYSKSCPGTSLNKKSWMEEAKKYNKIDEFDNAINILIKNGLISSPNYWKENAVENKLANGEYAGVLIKKMTKTNKLDDGLELLIRNKVINTSDYWKENAVAGKKVKGGYVRSLIIKMSRILN